MGRPGTDPAEAVRAPRHPYPGRRTTQAMDATQDGTDADRTEDEPAGPGMPTAEVPGPPSARRIDVRRRLMALRRW
jgi:hypothetical protein